MCVVTVTGNSRGGRRGGWGPHITVSLAIAIFSKRASERWIYSPEKPNVKCDIFIFFFPFSLLGFCFFIVCRLWGVIKGANRARVALVILAIGFELSDIGCENVVTKTALAE